MDSYNIVPTQNSTKHNIVFDINFTVWLFRSLFYDIGLNYLQSNLYSFHLRYYKEQRKWKK